MKRAFVFLFFLIFIVYTKEGYELFAEYTSSSFVSEGRLSDIAQQVTAITLEEAEGKNLKSPVKIKRNKNNLFVVDEGILYRYDVKGNFICRITSPRQIEVAEYMIDPVQNQLIVMGNNDDVYYYSYSGELRGKQKFCMDETDYRLLSMAFHNNRIWMMKEIISPTEDKNQKQIEKQLVEYDSSFIKINTYSLSFADAGLNQYYSYCPNPVISVREDTGEVYLFAPIINPETLLNDTLKIGRKQKKHTSFDRQEEIPVYPFRLGNRFWLSTYNSNDEEAAGYFYCYDWKTNKYWQTTEGLNDNFFHTGKIRDLQPMDLFNKTYYYTKESNSLQRLPLKNKNANPVVFIVDLKA